MLRLPRFLGNRFTDGGEVVSLALWLAALYSLRRFMVLISVRNLVDPGAIVWPEESRKLKNPINLS
jgi:hypothetical protein